MREAMIGESVYYWPSGISRARGDTPLHAVVSKVVTPERVNLSIFYESGMVGGMTMVRLVRDGEPPYDGAQCTWPVVPLRALRPVNAGEMVAEASQQAGPQYAPPPDPDDRVAGPRFQGRRLSLREMRLIQEVKLGGFAELDTSNLPG